MSELDLNPQYKAGHNFNEVDTIYHIEFDTLALKVESHFLPDKALPPSAPNKIRHRQQIFDILKPMYAQLDDTQEHLILLVLNRGELTGYKLIGSGGKDYAPIDMRVIFLYAILLSADTFILAHNHTCGQAYPSPQDIEVTEKIAAIAKVLRIPLMDHVIYTYQRKS